jgi:AraC-like DNA-binding protein
MDGDWDPAAAERLNELVELVRARVGGEGRMAAAVPGLWFFRADRPMPKSCARSATLYVGFAVQGCKRMRIGDLELTYGPPTYFVMRGETAYEAAIVGATPERPYLAIGIEPPPRLVAQTLLELVDSGEPAPRPAPPAPAFVAPLDAALLDALCRLVRSLDGPADRRVLAPLALREIVFRLLRSEAASALLSFATRNGEAARIQEAMAFIEANAARRLSVASLARQVAMSPSHFAHRFRDVASVSPMRFLKHVRLERARSLLVGEGLTVAEAAERVGYASASHFTRDFKRLFGLAPARYASAFQQRSTVPAPAPASLSQS